MESDVEHSAVLLGLAEVKVPLKKLTPEERVRMVHICYRKLLEIEDTEREVDEEKLKCIGVVDSFYALQEVEFTIIQSTCRLLRKAEVVLQYDLKDVIIALPALDCPSRVIIVSQTQGFGRTALVLQMQSREIAEALVERVSSGTSPPSRVSSNSKVRQGANTFGKAMGRKVNNLLSSFGNSDRPNRTFRPTLTPESSSLDSLDPSDEDDDLNADSDTDDSADLAPESSYEIETLATDHRPYFSKTSMSPQEAEINHLIQSEASFVEVLKRLMDFKSVLYDARSIIKKKHSDQMLMYIEELYSFHKTLLDLLKARESNVECVCSIFRENTDNFRYHVYYISNIPRADKVYNNYYETFKVINSSLGEDLRKPRMRLNHYILTFESLKKSSTEEYPVILEIIDVLRAYLKEADTRLATDSINCCPFNLMNHGHLAMSGELSLKKGEGLNKRRYHVLLLDDILVLTKGNQDYSEYVTSFQLLTTELVHEMRGVLIHINVKTNKKTILLIFKAKSIKLQQKWIEKFRIRIDEVKQKDLEMNSNNESRVKEDTQNEQPCPSSTTKNIQYLNIPSDISCQMPPLTIDMIFPKCLDFRLKEYENDPLSFTTSIQDSERLLIKSLDQVISKNSFKNSPSDEFSADVKDLYEFHLRYFYPALTFDQSSFENYVARSVLNKRKAFLETNSRLLLRAAVLKYEAGGQNLSQVFDIAIINFFKYMAYFSQAELVSEVKKKNIRREKVTEVFGEVLKTVNESLKRTYISEFPCNESVIMEGNLTIRESLEQTDQNKYVILTQENIHILSIVGSKFKIEMSLKNEKAKLGHPPGIKSFQIKFLTQKKQKKKYNFTAPDIETKSKWISSFYKVMPQEFKRKELIRISGRLRPKSASAPSRDSLSEISDCSTGTEFSLSVARSTSDATMMVSEL